MASWVELVKTQFKVTTGDGAIYTPKSFNANVSQEFNIAEFNFRNLDGTLVEKRRVMGLVYSLELYFEGGDCVEVGAKFRKSANNTKPWIITHPFYGKIKVQPITPIFYDNANNLLNVTKLTCTVKETIEGGALINTVSANDVITTSQASTATFYADYYVTAVPEPSVKDVQQMKKDINGFRKVLNTVSAGANTISNAYNSANAAVSNAIDNVSGAISSIQYYLSLPATIADTVLNRLVYLSGELESLIAQIESLHVPSLKQLWYTEAGTCISAMCLTTVTNVTTDYVYNDQVVQVISKITTSYNRYLASIDNIQTYNAIQPNSFVPDQQSSIALDDLVNYTIANLFTVQSNAKQPRTVTLTRDNNVIQVAFELYGLLPDDSTMDKIIADNNIYGEEYLQLPKGKQIVYYV